MPEGPEVRTVVDKLKPYLISRVIFGTYKGERARTIGFNNLKCPVTIIGVRSYGKKVLIDLDSGYIIIISLGMAGRLQYFPGNHSHVRFDLCDCEIKGSFRIMRNFFSLYFDDSRYMGGVDVISNFGMSLYFKDIGPDLLQLALDEKTWISFETWLEIFTKKKLMKRKICDVIMDQSLIAGIGNYLRSEILYYSRINPDRTVETITNEEWDRIRISSHKIIMLSYSYGGFTIKTFISPDGKPGMYPAAVYGKSHDSLGNSVIKMNIKSRNVHWVPAIQG